MFPPEHVRVVLIECRRQALSFDEAWIIAVKSLPRVPRGGSRLERARARELAEWKRSLAWARPFYGAAYAGHPFGDTPPLEEPMVETGAAAA